MNSDNKSPYYSITHFNIVTDYNNCSRPEGARHAKGKNTFYADFNVSTNCPDFAKLFETVPGMLTRVQSSISSSTIIFSYLAYVAAV